MTENKTRKMCVVTFEEDIERTHLLALTEDQLKLLKWLNDNEYVIKIKVNETAEVI